jgi:hypothetical protein
MTASTDKLLTGVIVIKGSTGDTVEVTK